MRSRLKLLTLVLLVVTASAVFTLEVIKRPPEDKNSTASAYDAAVREAKALFRGRLAEGVDMSSGPCLTNDLMQGWVVDIVHNPREKIDDLTENECPAYLEGRASHFVELDTKGSLVRVR